MDSSSSTGGDDDQDWDDWVSDSVEKQECPSLFDNTMLPSAVEAIAYDREKHGFDLDHVCSQLREYDFRPLPTICSQTFEDSTSMGASS